MFGFHSSDKGILRWIAWTTPPFCKKNADHDLHTPALMEPAPEGFRYNLYDNSFATSIIRCHSTAVALAAVLDPLRRPAQNRCLEAAVKPAYTGGCVATRSEEFGGLVCQTESNRGMGRAWLNSTTPGERVLRGSRSTTTSNRLWQPQCRPAATSNWKTIMPTSELPSDGTLRVRVTDDLLLDGGAWKLTEDQKGRPVARITPPATPMFQQVVAYLEAKPVPPGGSARRADEARAAVAVCLRWGSYFAVLADPSRPDSPNIDDEQVSQIDDEEMARMNIEISAALAWWLALSGSDDRRYWAPC